MPLYAPGEQSFGNPHVVLNLKIKITENYRDAYHNCSLFVPALFLYLQSLIFYGFVAGGFCWIFFSAAGARGHSISMAAP